MSLTETEFIKWMWRKCFKACSVHCHRCLTSCDVKLAPTYISNSLSEVLPTLFVQFTYAIRLSASQRTHRTLSCCAALIETANSLSQAKWAGRKGRGGEKNLTNATSKCGYRRDSLTWSRCLVTHTHSVLFMWMPHILLLLFFFVTCFVHNVPRWNDSSLQAWKVAFICNWVSGKIASAFFGVY